MEKFKEWIRKHIKHIAMCIPFVVVILVVMISCQGLANANGDGNIIEISKGGSYIVSQTQKTS